MTQKHHPNKTHSAAATADKLQRTAIANEPQLKTTNFTVDRNFATFRIQPGLKVTNTKNKNPPTPTSDQIDSLIPTIAETGRIKYEFQKKKNLEIKRR